MLFWALFMIFGFSFHSNAMETAQFIITKSHTVTIAIPREDLHDNSIELMNILAQLNSNTDTILKKLIPECYRAYFHNEQQTYVKVINSINQNVWEAYFALPLLVEIETTSIKHIDQLKAYGLITQETLDKRKQFFGDLALLKEKTKSARTQLKPVAKQWKKNELS